MVVAKKLKENSHVEELQVVLRENLLNSQMMLYATHVYFNLYGILKSGQGNTCAQILSSYMDKYWTVEDNAVMEVLV